MSEHHNLDVFPIPEKVLYINETGIADTTTYEFSEGQSDLNEDDNVRIYIPLDLNQYAILRRLADIGYQLGYPTETNDIIYSSEVQSIITQLEIYDQVWCVREGVFPEEPGERIHSQHARDLVNDILDRLYSWGTNSSAEWFPFEEIDILEEEYEITREHWWK